MRYAIVRNGVVENVTVWDGEGDWTPPAGAQVVPAAAGVSIGWSYDGEAFAPSAAPSMSLPEAAAAKLAAIETAFAAALVVGMPHGDKMIQMRDHDRANITGAAAMALDALGGGDPWPEGFAWRCGDDSWLALTAEQMRSLGRAAATWYYARRLVLWAKKDAVAAAVAAANLPALEAIDTESGWS